MNLDSPLNLTLDMDPEAALNHKLELALVGPSNHQLDTDLAAKLIEYLQEALKSQQVPNRLVIHLELFALSLVSARNEFSAKKLANQCPLLPFVTSRCFAMPCYSSMKYQVR